MPKKNIITPKGANFLAISFQMGVVIFLGTFGGVKLDQYLKLTPLFTILFSLSAITLSLYYIIKKLSPKSK